MARGQPLNLLGAPLSLGPLQLRNRVVFAAHLTNYAVDGLPTARHAAYYAARAAGGAGLIVTEEHTVHPGDRPYEKLIRGYHPGVLPGYRAIADAVHAHGAVLLLAQLNHNGAQSTGRYSRRPVWAPSAVPDPMFREVPLAVTAAQINELVAGYAEVARRCVSGGFDGVELQCSHASIVRQFLSPASNRRTDAYGGAPANRARFLVEIIGAVRAAIGPLRVLGVRLGSDLLGDLDELVAAAQLVAATGRVDYLNTSVGVAGTSQHLITPPMGEPAGYALRVSAAIRKASGLPVVGIGRFTSPDQAEQALAGGDCDLVGVVRGQISDQRFAAAALTGSPVRTCLGCNQECVGRVGLNRSLGCVRNPRAGREWLPPPPALAGGGGRVLVVGGGPAGLQVAATAAALGHRVTLCERAAAAGGQVRLAARAPGRAELGSAVDTLLRECERGGVELRTGTVVDAAFVQEFGPDAVVLATGSRPAPPPWAVQGVVDVRAVLDGSAAPAGAVLVYDELGFHQASSVAELLAARGCSVELLTPAMVVAQDLGVTLDRERFRRRAWAEGIRARTDRVVLAASRVEGRVEVSVLHHPTGTVEQRDYDAVVCALPGEPVDELWHALRGSVEAVHRVGDCLAPRRLDAAIIDGQRVGEAL